MPPAVNSARGPESPLRSASRRRAGSPRDEGLAVTDTTTTYRTHRNWPNPLHATLLAGTVPLFLGALLSDIAYYRSFHIQWSNFASWLIAGGLVFCGLAILDRKSTRLNSSHVKSSYAVFC